MDSRPVGFFDSGLGGVSVLGEAVRLLPCERFIYFGDTAHIPYGDKPPQQVLAYTHAAVDKLVALGCKAIVIACNTATSVAAGVLRQELSMPIIGMEPALKPAELLPGEGHVLVLATRVTLSLPKFHQLMRSYGQHAVPVPCPGLMELVEAGVMDGPEVDALLQKLLRPYAGLRIKAVLEPSDASNTNMSWTVADSGPRVALVDGNLGTVRQLQRRLAQEDLLSPGPGGDVTFLSSAPGAEAAMRRLLAAHAGIFASACP